MVAVSDDIRQEKETVKKQIKQLIKERIEKAKQDHQDGKLSTREFTKIAAELIALDYDIDMMVAAE